MRKTIFMLEDWIEEEWMQYAKRLGVTLQRARNKHGYSQASVAGRAGISAFTYRKLEHGISNPGHPANPRLRTLVALSRVLEIPLSELVEVAPENNLYQTR